MNNFTLSKIEKDILFWFANNYSIFAESIYSQIDLIQSIDREFTGGGAYISFTLSESSYIKVPKKYFPDYDRLDGLCLSSDEFSHIVPVSIQIDDDGKIDYIELEFGMRKKQYPKSYSLSECSDNRIIDY